MIMDSNFDDLLFESKKTNILNRLNVFNDPNFKFISEYHKYYYNDVEYIPVTKIVHDFSMPFDKDYWAERKSQELGIPKEQILLEWSRTNMNSLKIGTELHKWIENYYNKTWQELPNDKDIIKRINKFNIIYSDFLHTLQPVKFEMKIFSRNWRIAGTIDSLFLNKNNELYIIDWKTNKVFTHDEHPKGKFQKLLNPLDNYYKNHLNEYSIQLSVYSLILKEWGVNVDKMFLVHIGPDDCDPKVYQANDYCDILYDYLDSNPKYKIK